MACPAFLVHFADLKDPRVPRSRVHIFEEVLTIALLAMLCGAEGWEEISRFGQIKESWLRERVGLSLPAGIPCADTFRRLFARLEPEALAACLQAWTETLRTKTKGEIVSLDGKVLRHSFDHAMQQPALSMVRAWAGQNRLVLGAMPVDAGEGDCEMVATRRLLALLDIEGALVTADALHTQKETAAQIRSQGADYLLCVKANQAGLLEDLRDGAAGRVGDVRVSHV